MKTKTNKNKTELQTVKIVEVKPGDTIVVSLPRADLYSPEDAAKIEKNIRDELKMPEGVNVVVFFGQVDIFHLRKI